ncbi:TIGR03067 domain-containing protein [Rubinisphaera sp.]|uniref:TIGR03067 domain-containing protein n=1 Tax=Rubinisphaera sp. TaxID=2024857 RepID=UPI0025E882DC|nr:TIGR03067 domain-containing protein [Rubinisphaera sp.]
MRFSITSIIVCGLLLAMFSQSLQAFSAKEIQGKWQAVSMTMSGKSLDTDIYELEMLIENQKMKLTYIQDDFAESRTSKLELDDSSDPWSFVLKPSSSEKKSSWIYGILKIKGKKLHIATSQPGEGRAPEDFKSTAQNKADYMVFERFKD